MKITDSFIIPYSLKQVSVSLKDKYKHSEKPSFFVVRHLNKNLKTLSKERLINITLNNIHSSE